MEKQSWLRTIYLYSFALVGLILLIIGSVRFIDMGLKAWVFTAADEETRLSWQRPFDTYYAKPRNLLEDNQNTSGEVILSAEEKQELETIIQDYNDWKERRSQIDPVKSRRHRESATSLAMIIVGMPLYLYHWLLIKNKKVA